MRPKPRPHELRSLLAALLLVAVLTLPIARPARAQPARPGLPPPFLPPPAPAPVSEDLGIQRHFHDRPAEAVPWAVGQATLAALQQVVGLLLADPATDWSAVSLGRLRDHLVDLDRVMLHAMADERAVDGGLEIRVTGDDDTLEAARAVVPLHARALDGFRGWRTEVAEADGALTLRIASDDPGEVAVLRGLGFFGILATGVHRPHQLLAIARGR